MTITDTCKCGAAFSVDGSDEPFTRNDLREQHNKWLTVHAPCRTTGVNALSVIEEEEE